MSTNYLDNRSILDLRTKAAFIKAVNTTKSNITLGESASDDIKDDVEEVIFNFKEWLIENKKLLESVDSKFKTTLEKNPIKDSNTTYLYQFADESTKKQLSTSIDSTIHIIEELDTINLDSVDFDVFDKTITELSMLLYSNQEYGSETILSVLEDNYKNVTDEADIFKDPDGSTEDSTEALNDMFITTKLEVEDTKIYLTESVDFINSKMMTLIRIHFKLINILSDNFIKRVQSSRNMLKFKLLCMIIQNNIELDTTCIFKMINMDADNLSLVNKPVGESVGVSNSLPLLERLGIVYTSAEITEPKSMKIIAASENSRLLKNILIQDLYMDKITNIYNYTPAGELGPINVKGIKNSINAAKDKINFSTRGLQDLIAKVIEMLKNLFKGIANEEKKLQKYANDIKKALSNRTATGDKKKKVRIYTTSDLENAGLSNDKNSTALVFANRIEKDKRENLSNKVDFSSEDNVKRTLGQLVKNFDKMDISDFGKAVRNLFNYVDIDVKDDATAQAAKSAIKGKMATEDGSISGNIKNTLKKMPWAKKSLTYTNASGNKAYTQLAEALNTLYILCDGFAKLKGIDYLNKEQKNMTKLSNQLKRYLAKTASKTTEVKSESFDAISEAIRAYAEGIGDTMASSTGVAPKVNTNVSDKGNDIPDGDIEKEVVDPKDSDIKENKNKVKKVEDLGEYSDYVKEFITNYSKTVNYNMMFYKQFLNNLIKATVDNLTAFYAVTKNG